MQKTTYLMKPAPGDQVIEVAEDYCGSGAPKAGYICDSDGCSTPILFMGE